MRPICDETGAAKVCMRLYLCCGGFWPCPICGWIVLFGTLRIALALHTAELK